MSRPLGVERDVSTRCIGITGCTDACRQFGIAVPAAKGVACPGRCRQGDAVLRPVGKEVHRAAIVGSKVADALLVAVSHFAVGRRCPAFEGGCGSSGSVVVATRGLVVVIGHGIGTGEAVGSELLCFVVGEVLVIHSTTGIVVAIEMYGVLVSRPVSFIVKGIDIALGDNNLCLRCCAVTARPSGEGITCAGGVVQREGRRLYIISGVVGSGHRAACKVVGNVVGDGIPLGEESHHITVFCRQVVDALLVGIDHFAFF